MICNNISVNGAGHLTFAGVDTVELAKKYGKKTLAFAGSLGPGAERCNDHGIDACFSVTPGPVTLEEAMQPETAYENLKNTVRQVFRLLEES